MADSGRMRKRQIENDRENAERAVGVDGRRGWAKGGEPSFADVVEDEASVRGMRRLRERDVGQILFPPTSRRRNMTARGWGAVQPEEGVEARGGYAAPLLL